MDIPSENMSIFNNVISDLHILQSRYDANIISLNNKIKSIYEENNFLNKKIDEITTKYNNALEEHTEISKMLQDLIYKNNILLKESEDHNNIVVKLVCEVRNYKSLVQTLEDNHKQFTKVSHVVMIEKENCKLKKEIEELREKLKKEKETNNNFEPVKRGGLLKLCGLDLSDDVLLINNSDINNINDVPKILEENIILEPIKEESKSNKEDPLEESNDEEPNKEFKSEPIEEPKDEEPYEEFKSEPIEEPKDESNEDEIISECVYVKKIKGVKYYISDNEAMNIYEINPDDSKGKLLGFLEKKKGKDDDENVKLKVKWY
jgi:hypothetical protein